MMVFVFYNLQLQKVKDLSFLPSDRVVPVFTKPIVDAWQLASDNLQSMFVTYREEVTAVTKTLLAAVAKTSIGVLQFILSIIIDF